MKLTAFIPLLFWLAYGPDTGYGNGWACEWDQVTDTWRCWYAPHDPANRDSLGGVSPATPKRDASL